MTTFEEYRDRVVRAGGDEASAKNTWDLIQRIKCVLDGKDTTDAYAAPEFQHPVEVRLARLYITLMQEAVAQADKGLVPQAAGEDVKTRDERQRVATEWAGRAFGPEALNVRTRVARVLEEACELAQAEGLELELAELILRRTYSRPPGEPEQEAAGVGVTLLVYCGTRGVSADRLEVDEVLRVLEKPDAFWRARNDAKRRDGLP